MANAAHLDRVLDVVQRLDGRELPIVVVTAPDGGELHAGIGNTAASVMLYFPPGYDGSGSLHSLGDPAARDKDDWSPTLTLYYFTHHSEFPKWMGVPVAEMRQALRSFVRSGGKLPSNIDWEED